MPTSVGRIVNVSVKSFGVSSRKGRWGDDKSVDFATGGQDETKVSAGQPAAGENYQENMGGKPRLVGS